MQAHEAKAWKSPKRVQQVKGLCEAYLWKDVNNKCDLCHI